MSIRRLEIGCGPSPCEGYEHNDINYGPGVDHVGAAQDLNFPDGTFVEIFGTGAIEHLTYWQAVKFFRKAIRWLTPGGVLYIDAPDIAGWLEDMVKQQRSKSSVTSAFEGWCRWPGDEHKSFWTKELLLIALRSSRYDSITAECMTDRMQHLTDGEWRVGPSQNDWHVCVRAYRPFGDLPVVVAATSQADGWGSD